MKSAGGAAPHLKVVVPRKRGLSVRRYVFTGLSAENGAGTAFFAEYVAVNPALSPRKALRNAAGPSDDGFDAAKIPPPSYVLARAGRFGASGPLFEAVFPSQELAFNRREGILSFAGCKAGPESLSGAIEQQNVLYSLFSDSKPRDTFAWEIEMKCAPLLAQRVKTRALDWMFSAARAELSGFVQVNKARRALAAAPAAAYAENLFAREVSGYWFHVSAANFVSLNTNAPLENACVSAQSFGGGAAAASLALGSFRLAFAASGKPGKQAAVNCVRNGDDLHWTMSVENKRYVLDIDVYCPASDMKLWRYDSPAGGGEVLSLFCGASGAGEVRLYRKLKKGLEQLEHAQIKDARCEYGKRDVSWD